MKAYERFLDYVKIHTTSSESSGTHPSFEGEFTLAKLLKEQLDSLLPEPAVLDEHCYVYAHLPASPGQENADAIGFIAHMDTSDEVSGQDVKPVLHENYDGYDVEFPAIGKTMKVAQFPFLQTFEGETLITSDGTTLLGADDKAGIAEIITALERIISEDLPHPTIYIAFTPDEEIGEGTDYFDFSRFGASYAYTVDGGDVNCMEYENFNAATAKITIKGLSVHPGEAKDIMVNAASLAAEFHALLPKDECPEKTSGREGFFHLSDIHGDVSEATMTYLIRDHNREIFEGRKRLINDIVTKLNFKYGENTFTADVEDSYYNMLDQILPHMHLITNVHDAIVEAGLTPVNVPIRGGTDGARLSYDGIPCPNLGTGGYNFHSPFECISIERMDRAVDIILKIIEKLLDK